MINILVSGASGIVGYGILRSLRLESHNFNLIGTSIHNDSIAPAFCDFFEIAPLTSAPSYFEWLEEIIRKYSIHVLIPGIECDMIAWNQNRNRFKELGVFPLINEYELIKLCEDKWMFYQKLIEVYPQIAIPTCISIDDVTFSYPLLLKPRIGYGSKGIVKIYTKEDLEKYRNLIGEKLMVQPYIGDDNQEYTVSAFFDINSTLLDYLPLKRKLSSDGFTNVAQVVDLKFDQILNRLAAHLKPQGPTNFQFRMDNGSCKLLEINPRISSATSIRAKLGYNESTMSINYFLNNVMPDKIDLNAILNKRAIRYTEEVIMP